MSFGTLADFPLYPFPFLNRFHYNSETQQVPVLALVSKELNKAVPSPSSSGESVSFADPLDITSHHHPILLHHVAKELSKELGEEISPSQIHDFELSLYDTAAPTVGGALVRFLPLQTSLALLF
jgi:aspartyl aminopeptidase